ncbi:hypothetical protein [Homoserinibacter gongjuensis]|uniref:hypothetical protein n=1 Tax=Homoserinibacter gongjuensis TaxID=1162968 RepID=UPI0024E05B07|nr:hypothetical protein [Homoserinibacter gongjuensis]
MGARPHRHPHDGRHPARHPGGWRRAGRGPLAEIYQWLGELQWVLVDALEGA